MTTIGHIKLQAFAVECLVLTLSLGPFVLFVHFVLTEAADITRLFFLLPPWYYCSKAARKVKVWYFGREIDQEYGHSKS